MPITLIYHDVVAHDQADASGFPGGSAARYKLTPDEFRRHLDALAAATRAAPALIEGERVADCPAWTLTFDDGGAAAHDLIAGMLEDRGWRGHFFITAGRVGSPAFVTAGQVRDLDQRGHVVGSHSWSHPARMSALDAPQLDDEWRRSKSALEEILGKPVLVASVPGGYYSRAVGRSVAEAGYRVLFTSEPTARGHAEGGCRVLGRYSIDRGTNATTAAAIAAGRAWPRWRQSVFWGAKKVLKTVGGRGYLGVREWLLSRGGTGRV